MCTLYINTWMTGLEDLPSKPGPFLLEWIPPFHPSIYLSIVAVINKPMILYPALENLVLESVLKLTLPNPTLSTPLRMLPPATPPLRSWTSQPGLLTSNDRITERQRSRCCIVLNTHSKSSLDTSYGINNPLVYFLPPKRPEIMVEFFM